jgi:hypothetical protein
VARFATLLVSLQCVGLNGVATGERQRSRSGRGLKQFTYNSHVTLVGRPEGRRPLGRPKHRWEDNIKMDLREAGWVGMNWIDGGLL